MAVGLSNNIAYLYGLANGTRGTFVGAVYGPGGIGSMPEALVVEVAEYTVPAFYREEPRWVPILPSVAFKEGTRLSRTQFPIVAGFALTVNKAQGLTIKRRRGRSPRSQQPLPPGIQTRLAVLCLHAFRELRHDIFQEPAAMERLSEKATTGTCCACAWISLPLVTVVNIVIILPTAISAPGAQRSATRPRLPCRQTPRPRRKYDNARVASEGESAYRVTEFDGCFVIEGLSAAHGKCTPRGCEPRHAKLEQRKAAASQHVGHRPRT